MKSRKSFWIVSSIIGIIWGIYWLCVLLAWISADQRLMTAKIDLVLQWQTEIKQEISANSEEHKLFAQRKWTIDFINKKFNLK